MKGLGCGKVLNPYRTCGGISFSNKVILCEECRAKAEERVKIAKKKKWLAEHEHCDGCEVGYRCDTCKPEFDKLKEEISIKDILENG